VSLKELFEYLFYDTLYLVVRGATFEIVLVCRMFSDVYWHPGAARAQGPDSQKDTINFILKLL